MDTRTSIENCFKGLLKTMPYSSVRISEICAKLSITRSTFYSCYRDKEAIVESLFHKHVLAYLYDVHDVLTLKHVSMLSEDFTRHTYDGILAEREYYSDLVRPLGGDEDVFLRVATNGIYEFNKKNFPRVSILSEGWQIDYVSYYFAASKAMILQKWICDGFTVPSEDIAALTTIMARGFWDEISCSEKRSSR